MEVNKDIIIQKDNHKTILYHYFSSQEPKASILLLHGMAEHCNRYHNFAEYLCTNGMDVYLYDHRGHGRDKMIKELGFYSTSNGHKLVVEDALEVLHFVMKNKRSHKLFLFGHSMGSLIARNVIQQEDNLDGVILCGTTCPPSLKAKAGLFLALIVKLFNGPMHQSQFMNNLLFGSKLYTSLSTRTSFDWLSRDNNAVGAYIHDPYCGFICTISFYIDLIKLSLQASKPSLMSKTRADLPLYIISGDKDPVGGYGAEIQQLISTYEKLNFSKISWKLYPECRHELLQELNSHEIMEDVHNWINKNLLQ